VRGAGTLRAVRWKGFANTGLYKATGYKIVKADRLRRPQPSPRPRPRERLAREMPDHYDEDVKRIVRTVRQRTMTAHEKLHALVVATRHIVDDGIAGDFVECGVWRGGSMQAVAHTLLSRGVTDRDLHLFDTFEGMTEPSAEDLNLDGVPATELLERSPRTARIWAEASLEDVQEGMAETGYPVERVHYHVGRVEDTVPAQAPERIALLRLDTDWYESTRHELEHLYHRVPPGGVLIVDDYSTWQGARKAVDEFLEASGARLLLVPIAAGRIAVKPG
jgi:O-methyltransferase